jgi:hypothetical protein
MAFKGEIDLFYAILPSQSAEFRFRAPVTTTVERELRCIIHEQTP